MGLGGIFQALFHQDGKESEGAEVTDDELDQAAVREQNRDAAPRDPAVRTPREPKPVAERVRERFCRHMDRFVEELATERFRTKCTARQIVQAAGYPFAATALGVRRQWTDAETARDWLVRTAAILLHGRDGTPPLLSTVRDRYRDQGAEDVFVKSVGEGTLFVVMTMGLVGMPWPGPIGNLRRLVFIRDLWRAEELRGSASLEHVERLTRRYSAGDAVAMMREVAAPAGHAMDQLDGGLAALCEREPILLEKVPDRAAFGAGELLWGPSNGWAISLEAEADGKVHIYFPKRGKEALVRTSGYLLSVAQAVSRDHSLAPPLTSIHTVLSVLTEQEQ